MGRCRENSMGTEDPTGLGGSGHLAALAGAGRQTDQKEEQLVSDAWCPQEGSL